MPKGGGKKYEKAIFIHSNNSTEQNDIAFDGCKTLFFYDHFQCSMSWHTQRLHRFSSCFVGLLERRPSARIIRETWRELKQNKRLKHPLPAWEKCMRTLRASPTRRSSGKWFTKACDRRAFMQRGEKVLCVTRETSTEPGLSRSFRVYITFMQLFRVWVIASVTLIVHVRFEVLGSGCGLVCARWRSS